MESSQAGHGKPLPRRAAGSRATVESYLAALVLPRYMERLREIHDELAAQKVRLEVAYRDLGRDAGGDRDLFARRWREIARGWNFGYVNELIEQHNQYYPIEANLRTDPRTGEYLGLSGRAWRREPAGPEWVLERFPASPGELPGG